MAYMSQERKAQIAPVVKAICKKYNVKATLSVRNHMSLVLNIKQGPFDFMNNHIDAVNHRGYGERISDTQAAYIRNNKCLTVNPYWYQEQFHGTAKKFLTEVITAMNRGNHDNSDIMTDYFDVGWYVDVNIGAWDKPYVLAN